MAYRPLKNDYSSSDDGNDLPYPSHADALARTSSSSLLLELQRRLGTTLLLISTAGVVLSCLLSGLVLSMLSSSLRVQEALSAQYEYKDFATVVTTFAGDRRFQTLDHRYDYLWDEWTSEAQLSVPGELQGEGELDATFSMFHQLHCLASMRTALQDANEDGKAGFDYEDNKHWPHCFDYLRQSILCWADDTIEISAVIDGDRLPYIDGSRTMRQCRTPNIMYDRIHDARKKTANESKKGGEGVES